MRFPGRAFGDPAFDQIFLVGLERLFAFGRRHDFFDIVRGDALKEGAQFRLTFHDGWAVVALFEEAFFTIQAQFRFSATRVRTVTMETVLGENRSDIAIETNGAFALSCFVSSEHKAGQQQEWEDVVRVFHVKTFPLDSLFLYTLFGAK